MGITDRAHSPSGLVAAVRARASYENHSLGLRRDLDLAWPAPEPRLPLTVRPLQDRDVARILDPGAPGLSQDERHERRQRLAIHDAGLQTAYVAVTQDDEPTYVQWLIGHDQDDLVAAHFRGIFPRLTPDEALLEGAFTPEAWRGKRIMPFAMARIAELGVALGARRVITFVNRDNAASLAGCAKAGFSPYLARTESWRAFQRRLEFGPLPAG